MLTIYVPEKEFWDSKQNCFCYIKGQELQLEHSLLSLSNWESKWHIPFLNDDKRNKDKFQKTQEQLIDYVRFMTINKIPDDRIYYCLTEQNWKDIKDYMSNPMTATTFSKGDGKENVNVSGTFTTAEIIYYQMYELNIPDKWEKKHLNRLLTLIRVIASKKEQANNPKKMSKGEIANQQRALHAARSKSRASRKK